MALEIVGAFAGLALFLIFIWLFIIALAIFAFIFWILMLIDCLKRKFKQENDKIVWVLVLVFLQVIGALIYYFLVKKSDKR